MTFIETYKMMNNIYDQDAVPAFDTHPVTNVTRGHDLKIRRPLSRMNLGQNTVELCLIGTLFLKTLFIQKLLMLLKTA